jgi:hypothetical protein
MEASVRIRWRDNHGKRWCVKVKYTGPIEARVDSGHKRVVIAPTPTRTHTHQLDKQHTSTAAPSPCRGFLVTSSGFTQSRRCNAFRRGIQLHVQPCDLNCGGLSSSPKPPAASSVGRARTRAERRTLVLYFRHSGYTNVTTTRRTVPGSSATRKFENQFSAVRSNTHFQSS